MDKQTRNDLIDDLIYLRKDAGFVPWRLEATTVFNEIVGGRERDFDTLKLRLQSAINTLDLTEAEALRVAYGLLPDYAGLGSLSARREKYGERIGKKYDTLADRENVAIAELALALLNARYTTSPLPAGTPVMHNAALQERVEITNVVRDRLWLETRGFFRLIPLIEGVEYFEMSTGTPSIISGTNRDIVAKTITMPNGLTHRFYYKEPLKRGKPVELSFVMNPDVEKDDTYEYAVLEESKAFHEPTFSFRVEVIFLGVKPEMVWSFKQLPFFTRPGIPRQEHLIDLSDTSMAAAEFTDLYGGLFSGIAWRWD